MVIFHTKFRGDEVLINLADLTVQRLIQLQDWFGEEYGIPTKLMLKMGSMEAKAVLAALWINGQKIGKPIGDPTGFDFNFDEFEAPDTKPKRAPKGKQASQEGTSDGTTSSETPESSEDDSSFS